MFTYLLNNFFLLTAILFVVYSNSLNVPWILDDQANIVENFPVHLQQLSWSEIQKTFYAHPDAPGRLYRPVAVFSLALNWFVGQDNPLGYHIVNLCIHILTAFFLYIVCLYLVRLSLAPETFNRSGHFIALLAALLWAINPIQTQAVTYIVQRMAVLAALFSIIGIFFFLKARTAASIQKIVFFSLCCVLAFFLALGSKENAILFPFSLLLIDCIFFKSYKKIRHSIQKKNLLFFSSAFILILGYIIFFSEISLIGLSYEHRTFTLTQRILAAPYILLFYLSLLFFPLAKRLSIEHDIFLPTSFFSHWITVPSIAIFLSLLFIAFSWRKKRPFFAFALLFYFLNHTVESTVIHLEPIFEHRNYLPSLFLFLPLSAWIISFLERPQKKYAWIAALTSTISILIFFGINTYTRNQIWASPMSLWQDAQSKAPNSNRAAINLAREYIRLGDTEKALILSEKAYTLWHPSKNYAQALSLNAQGVVADIKNKHHKAALLFKQSLKLLPNYGEARNNLVLTLSKQYLFQDALEYLKSYNNPQREGILLLWLGQEKDALKKFHSASEIFEINNVTGIGKALSMLGQHEQANLFLKQTVHFSSLSNLIYIENLLRAKKIKDAEEAARQILITYNAQEIFNHLFNKNPTKIPLEMELVKPLILQEAKKYISKPLN